MAANNLTKHNLSGITIIQRESDGYINATSMCTSVGKLIAHYRENKRTDEFLSELSLDIGIPITDLIKTVRGGRNHQGTWVHPKVSINLATWLSPKFEVKVTNFVYEWMMGKAGESQPEQKQLPPVSQPKPETITTVITIEPGQPPRSQSYKGKVALVPCDALLAFEKAASRLHRDHMFALERATLDFLEAGVTAKSTTKNTSSLAM